MPIKLNPAVTSQPKVADCGMPSPDEELLDLDTPSCSPTFARIVQDYQLITDQFGAQRHLRTAQVVCDLLEHDVQ